ncbi:MAG: hypothetical protein KDG50_01535 [Chromatiales bacterium]|nr:hypothetical protein [Chromatiales bacterium]
MLRKKTRVLLTPTALKVKTRQGWFAFDRTLTYHFGMLRHDRTREEQEDHDLRMRRAQKQGNIIRPKRYCAESAHIVFEHVGHRRDITKIYDRFRAAAVVARLKACDEVMNNHARLGDGEAMGPEDQWGDQPGDLP